MEFAGKIYKPNKTNPKMILEEKLLWYGMGTSLLSCIILILNDNFFNIYWVEIIFKLIAIVSIITALLSKLVAMSRNEPLSGDIDGHLTITNDRIKINEYIFDLKDISSLELNLVDYSGKMYSRPNYPGPWGSNGADNKIDFCCEKERFDLNFIISNETEFELLKKIHAEIKNNLANRSFE